VIYDCSKGVFRIWFVSESFWGSRFCISSGISLDGVNWYTNMRNPVLHPSLRNTFDETLRSPAVVLDGSGYKMYYTGDSADDWHQRIGLATSADGITWQKYYANPIIPSGPPGSWDCLSQYNSTVIHKGNLYYMWYVGNDSLRHNALGLATSPDGIQWTKYAGNPVFRGDSKLWDRDAVAAPAIVLVGNTFYMFYIGWTGPPTFSIGWAYSKDGISWTGSPSNPILQPSNGWEGASLGNTCVVFRENKFLLYYSGQSVVTGRWQIGLATSEFVPLAVEEAQSTVPARTALMGSYPNPFNPETQIRYSVATSSVVSLKVYDVLGREVAVLLDQWKSPGEYTVRWNPQEVPTGTYYCQMAAGDVRETKKLMLIK
jgi:beta-1,2-mannobiose phosphorylase / 1,2-beta-oligomannan phosphorylase